MLTVALCPPPLVAVRVVAGAAVLVSAKLACVNVPDEATTSYNPTVEFAVKVFEVAWPFVPVTSISIVEGGVVANVPLTPEAGAVKVTETPLTGLPWASVAVATNGSANAVLTVALWPSPLVAVSVVATVAVLVKAKLADVVAPDVEAVTL